MPEEIRAGVWSGFKARFRSLTEGVRARPAIEAEMQEEFETHIEMRTDDLIAEGLSPAESLRKARAEFGLVETHKAAARSSRGLGGIDEVRFSPLIQLALGTAIGLPPAYLTLQGGFGGSTWSIIGLMSTGLLVILLIGILACTSPTARALRIEPTKALRQE